MAYNILITSAGTASAIGVIKSLRMQKELELSLIAVDADNLAPGLFLADKFYVVSKVNEPNYLEELIDIIKRDSIDLLVPIYSREIEFISTHRTQLESATGVKLFIPEAEAVRTCDQKRLMNDFADQLNIPVPTIYSIDEVKEMGEKAFPLFVKPNMSSGTRGAMKVENMDELNQQMSSDEDIIIQSFLEGEEVTVDMFCDSNNDALVISPRTRLVTKVGQTIKGKTIKSDIFIEPSKKLSKALKMVGAFNIQYMVKDIQLTLN